MTRIVKDRKLYGNCQVFSPDGHLMFRCDQKKANWYLNRDLAEIIKEEPLTIRLIFQPKGLGNSDKLFGLSEMENKCVNCGSEEYLTRHHVVPICYRKYFPLELKSHNFHDVLSLCKDCHENYERKADELKHQLAEKYSISVDGVVMHDKISTGEILNRQIIKGARLLLRDITNIPSDRINEIKLEIKSFLGREFTNDDLIEISSKKDYVCDKTHGEIVISNCDDIQSFIELWREHFLQNNDCKYLPKNWDVKNKIIINE